MGNPADPFLRMESLIDGIDTSVTAELKSSFSMTYAQIQEVRRQNDRLSKAQAEAIIDSAMLISSSAEEVQHLARAQAEAIVRAAMVIIELESSLSELRREMGVVRKRLSEADRQRESLAKSQAEAIVSSAAIISELEETKQQLKQSHQAEAQARQAAERLSSFGKILDSSDNEIYIFDSDTLHFIHVNHGAQQNLGYSMDELRKLTPFDLKKQVSAVNFEQLVAPLRSGLESTVRFTSTHFRKDGTEYPVEVHLEYSTFEGKTVFVAVILDMTSQMKLETELRESREAAIAADRAKSAFLANMSHEIRTPMTAILGFSELLLEEKISEQERCNAVSTIQRNGQHLLHLINDILDLSKVESGKLQIENTKLNPVQMMNEVVELLKNRAEARGNQLVINTSGPLPQTILSDPTRLKQALVNLVGNAIKFTKNGIIRIVAECDCAKEQMIFHVIDTGIGMTPEQIERIFKPFGQADASTTREYGGTGLGLTITKRIAELLGGNAEVASQQNMGSTFTLTVGTGTLAGIQMTESPVHHPAETQRPTKATAAPNVPGRVLLVEDGVDNQRLISFVLKKAGAKVVIAENGKIGMDQALDAWHSGKPFGLILMDMQMPVMDGYTATGSLREAGYPYQIVALTAHAMKHDIDKCLSAGCDAYLSKPIDRVTFLHEVAGRMGKVSLLAKTPTI